MSALGPTPDIAPPDPYAIRVAIIGGGPTAVALLQSLIHARDRFGAGLPLDVTVFDPTPHPWCGENFAADRPEAVTNSFTNTMSVRHWQPEHVADWLTAAGCPDLVGDQFAPRSVIGRYFEDSAQQAIDRIQGFAFIREYVTGLSVVRGRPRVSTQRASHDFDYAILSVGGSDAFDPYQLAGQENFCPRPYPLKDTLAGVDPDENIGIIGTGLTAVDLVMGLKTDSHRGRITLLSRHGLLPAPRPTTVSYDLQRFTVERIEEYVAVTGSLSLQSIVDLIRDELDNAGTSAEPLVEEIFSARYGVDRLRQQLANGGDGGIAYAILIKMLLVFQDAWYLLAPADKSRLTGIRHMYSPVCCPMARDRATQVLALADVGQLDVVRGLRSITARPGGKFVATASNRPPLQFDRVFAAGSSFDKANAKVVPICDSLLRSGQGRAHPFGGLDVERTTSRLLDTQNRPQPRLYAVGTLTSGAFMVLNGYPVLRIRAVQIADAIIQHCCHASSAERTPHARVAMPEAAA